MIHSTRAISLVLVSAVSVLGGYHALRPSGDFDDQSEWGPSTTQPSSGNNYYGSHGYHSTYYHHWYSSGSSGFVGSGYNSGISGSHSSAHGTSHGGFGSTGHAAHS